MGKGNYLICTLRFCLHTLHWLIACKCMHSVACSQVWKSFLWFQGRKRQNNNHCRPVPPLPQPIVNKFQFITVDFAETYFGTLQLGLMLSNAIFIRVSLCNTEYSGESLQAAGAHDCLWHVQLKGLLFQERSSFWDCIELGLILIASFSQES